GPGREGPVRPAGPRRADRADRGGRRVRGAAGARVAAGHHRPGGRRQRRDRARPAPREGNPAMTVTIVRAPVDSRESGLADLEDEAVHILRGVVATFERPALLFSGGKDSIVMLRLAEKAFWPGRIPFPLMHVDTGHNFPEVIDFRDRRVAELGVRLVVASVQEP